MKVNDLKNKGFVPVGVKRDYTILKSESGVILSHKDGEMEGFLKKQVSVDDILSEGMNIREKVFTFIAIGLGITHFNTDITVVDGISMEPKYKNMQLIIKSSAARQVNEMMLHNNTIVKFKLENDIYIKRIVGVPGDEIEFDAMYVKVNGEIIDNTNQNPHPEHGAKRKAYSLAGNGKERKVDTVVTTITLKDGEYFVMGDNRPYSIDSRKYGPINTSNIISILEK
jgi:signal peptidase I